MPSFTVVRTMFLDAVCIQYGVKPDQSAVGPWSLTKSRTHCIGDTWVLDCCAFIFAMSIGQQVSDSTVPKSIPLAAELTVFRCAFESDDCTTEIAMQTNKTICNNVMLVLNSNIVSFDTKTVSNE